MTEQLNSHGLPILPATQKKDRQGCSFNHAANRSFANSATRDYRLYVRDLNMERERRRDERERRALEQNQSSITSKLF